MAEQGVFISFEGGEGAGKTTHIAFMARCLQERGYEVLCLREPGGTKVGEDLRAIVLDPANDKLCDQAELLIYEAARAQIVSEVIAPALSRGAVVLCDRFFDSTVAYQAYGRGLSRAFVDSASAFACQGITPQRTILMVSATAEEGLSRATEQGADRLELAGVDFHSRVNQAFLDIAAQEPDRVRIVRFAEHKEETAHRVFSQVADLFPWMKAIIDDAAYFDSINED